MNRGSQCSLMAKETGCLSTVARTVWDGDQILVDIRQPTSELETDVGSGNQHFGRVVYVHGGGIDRPLALVRMDRTQPAFVVVPQQNWRGFFDGGQCLGNGVSYCAEIEWPGKSMTTYLKAPPPIATGPTSWYGSLVSEKADGSGYLYMRNRYFDPATGRFTQEDPIGLAGGLNVYGFGGGDPVNFTDPFGLCPVEVDGVPCSVEFAQKGAAYGLGFGVGFVAVGAIPSGGTVLLGSLGIVSATTGLGAAAGGLAGKIRDNQAAISTEMAGLTDAAKRLLGIIVAGWLGATTPGLPPSDDTRTGVNAPPHESTPPKPEGGIIDTGTKKPKPRK
jgi:RHS repeat-associated protein